MGKQLLLKLPILGGRRLRPGWLSVGQREDTKKTYSRLKSQKHRIPAPVILYCIYNPCIAFTKHLACTVQKKIYIRPMKKKKKKKKNKTPPRKKKKKKKKK